VTVARFSDAFVLNPGHMLVKLFHPCRQIPPIEGIKASRLFFNQLLFPPFKVGLPHEKNELAFTQNPMKV
jgi:hypothetical protein